MTRWGSLGGPVVSPHLWLVVEVVGGWVAGGSPPLMVMIVFVAPRLSLYGKAPHGRGVQVNTPYLLAVASVPYFFRLFASDPKLVVPSRG